jgi:hypothetical protein
MWIGPVDTESSAMTTTEETRRRFFATAEAQDLVARLAPLIAGEPRYVDEVPVGGKAAR